MVLNLPSLAWSRTEGRGLDLAGESVTSDAATASRPATPIQTTRQPRSQNPVARAVRLVAHTAPSVACQPRPRILAAGPTRLQRYSYQRGSCDRRSRTSPTSPGHHAPGSVRWHCCRSDRAGLATREPRACLSTARMRYGTTAADPLDEPWTLLPMTVSELPLVLTVKPAREAPNEPPQPATESPSTTAISRQTPVLSSRAQACQGHRV
jgi:hypothetical protein